MPAGLKAFLACLQQAGQGPDDAVRHFVFDQRPDVGLVLRLRSMSLGQGGVFLPLLTGTERSPMAAYGPLWCSVEPGSPLARHALAYAARTLNGLAVEADDEGEAQVHARHLLRVREGAGSTLSTYYRPARWAAMALTNLRGLHGPWNAVYTCAPRHIGNPRGTWLRWPASASAGVPDEPYIMAHDASEVFRTLRWVYWLDLHFLAFGQPDVVRLPQLIDNLELLARHGITEGRWLLRLTRLCNRGSLAEDPAVQTVLQSADVSFNKFLRLLAL